MTAKFEVMVIEYLTFTVDPAGLDTWLAADEQIWSRFLERRPGFIGKQVWVERGRPHEVHAVITWADEGSWHAIAQSEIDALDADMGALLRIPACRTFDVIRHG